MTRPQPAQPSKLPKLSRDFHLLWAGETVGHFGDRVTLFVIPAGAPPTLAALGATGGLFQFRLNGLSGERYAILSGSDLVSWQYLQTNTLASNSLLISVSLTNSPRFYRAQWLP